jgi:precorrin-2/cobalt-factor-2 C20-methyltransferase
MTGMSKGTLIGVGLGPGDPELMTVKAVEAIRTAPVIAFFAKEGRRGNARTIADRWIPTGSVELPLYYPVTTEIPVEDPDYGAALGAFYQTASERLAEHLEAGRDVALLAEGDPLFYGSFMHLYIRLRPRFATAVIPGVAGMMGCWSAAGEPMTWGDDVLTVLPGTLPEEELVARLAGADAAVIMKIGRNFAKVRSALDRVGMLSRAIYVERGTMPGETVMKLEDKTDGVAPYFSLVLIPGNGRRP